MRTLAIPIPISNSSSPPHHWANSPSKTRIEYELIWIHNSLHHVPPLPSIPPAPARLGHPRLHLQEDPRPRFEDVRLRIRRTRLRIRGRVAREQRVRVEAVVRCWVSSPSLLGRMLKSDIRICCWLWMWIGLYTDESPGLKVDPVVVLVLSLVFIFSVVALHSMPFLHILSQIKI